MGGGVRWAGEKCMKSLADNTRNLMAWEEEDMEGRRKGEDEGCGGREVPVERRMKGEGERMKAEGEQ